MTERKKFTSLTRKEEVFEIDGHEHVVRQASARAARIYREKALDGTEMDMVGEDADLKRTIRRIQGIAGLENLLVSLCVFKRHADGQGWEPVTLATVEEWSGEVTRWAYSKIKEFSPWLDERDEDDVESLRKQRDRLDKRIERLEAANPKA